MKETRYGENPHQKGKVRIDHFYRGPSVLGTPLHGKAMSYNNILDANAALEVMIDCRDENAAVVIKHQNPCGLAIAASLAEALENAWRGDEISAFGSAVGFSQEVSLETMQALYGRFVEVIVAPSYSEEALAWVQDPSSKKSKLRVIETGSLKDIPYPFQERHAIRGGEVMQTMDNKMYLGSIDSLFAEPQEFEEPNTGEKYTVGTVSKRKLPGAMKGLVNFGMIAVKHTKSNAIVLGYEYKRRKYRVLGMGAGQPNRMDAAKKLAIPKAQENLLRQYCQERNLNYQETNELLNNCPSLKSEVVEYQRNIFSSERVVAFSDAFFPFRDGIDVLADVGISYVVSPGGSINDVEIIKAANEQAVGLIHTGVRHFKH